VGDLGIWPNIIGMGYREARQWKEEEWSMDNGKEREILNTQTI